MGFSTRIRRREVLGVTACRAATILLEQTRDVHTRDSVCDLLGLAAGTTSARHVVIHHGLHVGIAAILSATITFVVIVTMIVVIAVIVVGMFIAVITTATLSELLTPLVLVMFEATLRSMIVAGMLVSVVSTRTTIVVIPAAVAGVVVAAASVILVTATITVAGMILVTVSVTSVLLATTTIAAGGIATASTVTMLRVLELTFVERNDPCAAATTPLLFTTYAGDMTNVATSVVQTINTHARTTLTIHASSAHVSPIPKRRMSHLRPVHGRPGMMCSLGTMMPATSALAGIGRLDKHSSHYEHHRKKCGDEDSTTCLHDFFSCLESKIVLAKASLKTFTRLQENGHKE